MSKKTELLYEKIFYNFITGKYGTPKIPEDREILNKIKDMTQDNNDPLLSKAKLSDIDIDEISKKFQSTIDDIDILYSSVEDQSNEIMDQLTHSLKEHNGAKRELRNIETRAKDIQAGKMGNDYLKYIYTENFIDLSNIDTIRSTIDPDTSSPIIDIKSGSAYIPNALINLVDLTHYYGRKLEIINTDYTGHISDAGWEGHSDAAAIFDISDERRLMYRIKTSEATSLTSSFVIQLTSDRRPIKINGILLHLDSDSIGGQLRIEYKTSTGWKSIPDFPQKVLDNDKLTFRFQEIETTHVKFKFIKEYPDLIDSNEYFIIMDGLTIMRADTHKTATLYSKSIKMDSYDKEKVVIKNLSAYADGFIPEGCSVDVYVARDKEIPGYFSDSNNNYVTPESVHIDHFVPDLANTYPERHVLLSDIKNHPYATGVLDYTQLDYDWKIIKSFSEHDNLKPEIINFADINSKTQTDNSLYQEASFVFGDPLYYATYGIYPQPDQGYDPWFLSGVIDADNEYWSYISGYVAEEMLVSGHDYGDPVGYPFNYYDSSTGKYLRFGDNHYTINGWWRPSAENVTPSGITEGITIEDPAPDFYFNGMRFYKIFKIDPDSAPIETSIKLYSYQTKPIYGGVADYYPHNLIWNYNSRDIIKTAEYSTKDGWTDTLGNRQETYPADSYFVIPMESGHELVNDSLREVHYEGHSNILTTDTHYRIYQDQGEGDFPGTWYMRMLPISSGTIYHPDAHVSMKYSYKYEDKYTSYWEGYIIADEDSDITIKQQYTASFADLTGTITKSEAIVGSIIITTVDGEPVYNNSLIDKNISIDISKGIYKVRIFCLSNNSTSYSADKWSPYSTAFFEGGTNIKLVPRIEPIKITNFDILLHSTPYENDNRASIIQDKDGYKFIVVKEPSKNIMPGYYYDRFQNSYLKEDSNLIRNIGHYHRTFIHQTGASGYYIENHITGSSGNLIMSGDYMDFNSYEQDTSWNNGYLDPPGFSNYDETFLYPQHSTFGSPINIEDTLNNSGHLFYNTAENLPAFYTIEYNSVNKNDPTIDRFLYKIQLRSEHEVNTPVLNSLKFTINEEQEI